MNDRELIIELYIDKMPIGVIAHKMECSTKRVAGLVRKYQPTPEQIKDYRRKRISKNIRNLKQCKFGLQANRELIALCESFIDCGMDYDELHRITGLTRKQAALKMRPMLPSVDDVDDFRRDVTGENYRKEQEK